MILQEVARLKLEESPFMSVSPYEMACECIRKTFKDDRGKGVQRRGD